MDIQSSIVTEDPGALNAQGTITHLSVTNKAKATMLNVSTA
jgi:hypothetical protein